MLIRESGSHELADYFRERDIQSEKKKERRTRLGYPTNSPSDLMSLRIKQTPKQSLEIAKNTENQQ